MIENITKRTRIAMKLPGRAKPFTRYSIGKKMVKYLDKRGVTMEEMIKNTDDFLPELDDRFGILLDADTIEGFESANDIVNVLRENSVLEE